MIYKPSQFQPFILNGQNYGCIAALAVLLRRLLTKELSLAGTECWVAFCGNINANEFRGHGNRSEPQALTLRKQSPSVPHTGCHAHVFPAVGLQNVYPLLLVVDKCSGHLIFWQSA